MTQVLREIPMTLKEVRVQFKKISGRYDLVDDAGNDQGADFYINAGSRFLDRLDETQKSPAVAYKNLAIGTRYVKFPYCRAIKEVWISDATNGRWQLTKKTLADLTANYLADVAANRDNGTPLYYSPQIMRHIPESTAVLSLEALTDFVDTQGLATNLGYNGILIAPAPELTSYLEIRGLYYSSPLGIDTDQNYWTVNEPLILIMAAMHELEVVNRNTQGVNDWLNAIKERVMQLGMDRAEEEVAEAWELEG